jgi:hypothetical protein
MSEMELNYSTQHEASFIISMRRHWNTLYFGNQLDDIRDIYRFLENHKGDDKLNVLAPRVMYCSRLYFCILIFNVKDRAIALTLNQIILRPNCVICPIRLISPLVYYYRSGALSF